jgi:hypothetical protein
VTKIVLSREARKALIRLAMEQPRPPLNNWRATHGVSNEVKDALLDGDLNKKLVFWDTNGDGRWKPTELGWQVIADFNGQLNEGSE